MLARLLLLIAMAVGWGGALQAQDLTAAAKREKERRTKASGTTKTFTDSDLRDAKDKRAREGDLSSSDTPAPADPPSPPAPRSGPSGPQAPGSKSTNSPDAAQRAAEGFKASLASAEASLRRAEAQLKAAEDHWSFVNGRTNDSFSLNEARSRLEAAKKDVEQCRKQRDDIEDAARRQGIPPGYLR